VPMPEGSSSDAPVIKPGPSIFKKRLTGFGSRSKPFSRMPLGVLLLTVCWMCRLKKTGPWIVPSVPSFFVISKFIAFDKA
jgi:hypothetical protein